MQVMENKKQFLKNHFENLPLFDIFYLIDLQVNSDSLFKVIFIFYIFNYNQNNTYKKP